MLFWQVNRWRKNASDLESIEKCAREKTLPIMPQLYKEELNERGDSDFAYENEHARYRVSVVRQRLGIEIVFRVINSYVRTMIPFFFTIPNNRNNPITL